MTDKTIITIALIVGITICVIFTLAHKADIYREGQETERSLKQDKKTTIDFGFGRKDK